MAAMVPAGAATPPSTQPIKVEHNVRYGTHDGSPLLLDVYQPAERGSGRAAVMMIHGGAWYAGSKAGQAAEGSFLARHGYVAFAVDYTLDSASVLGYPLQIHECQAAFRWIQDHAGAYGIDRRRMAVFGGSAGGYLAAMVALLGPGRPGYARAAAAVSLSGPMDITAAVDALKAGKLPCPPRGCHVDKTASLHLQWLLGCVPLSCPASLLKEASPISHVTSPAPPFFLFNHASEAIPVTQATEMAAALRKAGVPVTILTPPGTKHGPNKLVDVAAPIGHFLSTYLPPEHGPSDGVLAGIAAGAAAVVGAAVTVGVRLHRRRSPTPGA